MTMIMLSETAGFPLKYGNRHGLIAGATGSGKTRTVQTLVEEFSKAGVPSLVTDIKGDLSGLAHGFPVRFWDLFREDGLPMRTSIHEMGPLVLSRLLNLNEVQEGVLGIAYRWIEAEGSPYHGRMLDIPDLRAIIGEMSEHADDLREEFGHVTNASLGAIQRAILKLDVQGGDNLFGEPALDIADLLLTDEAGRGVVNVLSADRLMESQGLYSGFMIWLLMSLFTGLPEVGDADKPKLVIVIDEAHMIFNDASKVLLDTIERVIRLIRSRGVGIYFASQNPLDIPSKIAAQLGNRVQHSLRAFTPKEHKSVKSIAQTFRKADGVDVEEAITNMAVGEALVSVIGAGGVPTPVARTRIRMPTSQISPIDRLERIATIRADPLKGKYGKAHPSRDDAYIAFMARIDAAEAVAVKKAKENVSWADDMNIPASAPRISAEGSTCCT